MEKLLDKHFFIFLKIELSKGENKIFQKKHIKLLGGGGLWIQKRKIPLIFFYFFKAFTNLRIVPQPIGLQIILIRWGKTNDLAVPYSVSWVYIVIVMRHAGFTNHRNYF